MSMMTKRDDCPDSPTLYPNRPDQGDHLLCVCLAQERSFESDVQIGSPVICLTRERSLALRSGYLSCASLEKEIQHSDGVTS